MTHSCPFCNSEFDAFNPFGHTAQVLRELEVIGGGGRKNALCPRCGSLDRERLVRLYLEDKPVCTLLHIAPAPCLGRWLKSALGDNYISAKQGPGAMYEVDLTDVQVGDNIFDAIICNHVLEHIEDDRKAMSELYRILKPGGWAILQVPLSLVLMETLEDSSARTPEERYRRFGQQDHVRIYAQADYPWRLARAGFVVETWDAVTELGAEVVVRYGLNPLELLYIGHKEGEC